MGDYEGFTAKQEIKEAVYRVDPQNGQSGNGHRPDRQAERHLFFARLQEALRSEHRHAQGNPGLRRGRQVAAQRQAVHPLDIPGTGAPSAADGIRCDADGNVWAGARPGVQVVAPDGTRIGKILLPETCANVCFGGSSRNRLFMTASQSLYAVYVDTTGAHFA